MEQEKKYYDLKVEKKSKRMMVVEYNCSECDGVNVLELTHEGLFYDHYCESETPEQIEGQCGNCPYEGTQSRVFLVTDLTDDELINKYESKKVHS